MLRFFYIVFFPSSKIELEPNLKTYHISVTKEGSECLSIVNEGLFHITKSKWVVRYLGSIPG